LSIFSLPKEVLRAIMKPPRTARGHDACDRPKVRAFFCDRYNMPEGFMPSKRSRHPRQLSSLLVATVFFLLAEVSEPPLSAHPPNMLLFPTIPKPLLPKPTWFGINWKKLIPKTIPKIKIPAMRAPKAAHIARMFPKQNGRAGGMQPMVMRAPNAPNVTPQPRLVAAKPQPIMKPALHELTEALLYVNASPLLPTRSRNAVGAHISQALAALGGTMPKASAASKKGNHLKLAEEHLIKANKEVLLLGHLSPALQNAVLKEIKSARDLVKKHANAVAGKDAKP
jgi:hypothetical protein